MTELSPEPLSVVVERELPFPAEKIWRALTQPHLIQEWLMQNDFVPVVGNRFSLRSVVTRTLRATSTGTHLRMEQSGFRADQQQAYRGATYGWQRFFADLERVVGVLS